MWYKWDMAQIVESALANFSHGRRVFALQQLEALVQWEHAPAASESMAYLERKIEELTKRVEENRERLQGS